MTISKGKELLQPFFDSVDKDGDPYMVCHFSRQADFYQGYHERLGSMDAVMIISELVKFFELDEIMLSVAFEMSKKKL